MGIPTNEKDCKKQGGKWSKSEQACKLPQTARFISGRVGTPPENALRSV
ncbi:hypothetical protein [Iningainema tapete]|uniref:Uncharacterized protein n=1 Tax=Iningainema tapete BLCC-T55 TaxID=2748662 RepID=A0A8J6XQ91_9CYAN|nr:hypothetical protein [Iningainema tapete]MBD2775386.1 hypothetical protein [Iningainema tapete BLCC-T55]